MKCRYSPKIGLLGGSFNPAHEGHVHLSLQAIKKLGLREIWWLVSPQNPLKSKKDMLPYEERVQNARKLTAKHPHIKICEIESELGLQYTVDSLRALKKRFNQHQFIWLMGADNLLQFHKWRGWRSIAAMVPIVVCDRAPSSHAALRSPAALSLSKYKMPDANFRRITQYALPRWGYFFMQRNPESASRIRRAKKMLTCH